MPYYPDLSVSELIGKTLVSVERSSFGSYGDKNDSLRFVVDDGSEYQMWHEQDCCESVTLDDVAGDLNDLVGTPILLAEEVSNECVPPRPTDSDDSWTWTFYKIATMKGRVTLRWFGTSNGYYSESVTFAKVK